MSEVSVIIPLFNGKDYILEAIESIKHQTYPIAEIIVVDDGSSDGGSLLLENYDDVTLLKKEHSGINATLNIGLDNCKGSLIAFLDADDRWLPDKTALQLDILSRNSELDMVFGHSQRFEMIKTDEGVREQMLDIVPGVTRCGGLFRRELFNEVGYFSAVEGAHSFIDWFTRFQDKNKKMLVHPEIVFQRRIHESNFGKLNKDLQKKQYFATIRAALERRKAALNNTNYLSS